MATVKAKQPDQGAPDRKHNIEAMRQDYYARISQHGMTPLWKVMGTLFRDEPVSRCAPAVWHFDDVKSLVMEAGGLITAEEAKRRVLILENPALRGGVARYQYAVRRHSDDHAGRDRAGASPCLLRDPFRA